MMPGRSQKEMTTHKPKMRRIKAKHQRKRFMRAKDPVLAVFMWGVQHTVSVFIGYSSHGYIYIYIYMFVHCS